jgi:hypothetical protein
LVEWNVKLEFFPDKPTPAAGSFNELINSGIVHLTGVLIVPFLAAVTGTNGGLGDNKWKSPFERECVVYWYSI